MFEKLAIGLGAALILSCLVFLGAIAGAAFGALGGMVTAWFFPDMMARLTAAFGFIAPYQTGAALGFVGAFFHSSLTQSKD